MINNKKPLHQIITEKIQNVFYQRINPFPNINFVTNAYSKGEVGLEKLGTFKALKELRKQVSEVVDAIGVTMFKGTSIWNLSVYEMKNALPLIKHGIAKQEDFQFSPISKIKNPKFLSWLDKQDAISLRIESEDLQFKELARGVSQTEEEFSKLWISFSRYKNDLYRIIAYSDKITNFITKTNLKSYNGVDLYEIKDREILDEAFEALSLVVYLKDKSHITHYNNEPIEHLNLFTLQKIEIQIKAENLSGLTINKPVELVKEEALALDYEQRQKDKKALQAYVRRVVQAELKKPSIIPPSKKTPPKRKSRKHVTT